MAAKKAEIRESPCFLCAKLNSLLDNVAKILCRQMGGCINYGGACQGCFFTNTALPFRWIHFQTTETSLQSVLSSLPKRCPNLYMKIA